MNYICSAWILLGSLFMAGTPTDQSTSAGDFDFFIGNWQTTQKWMRPDKTVDTTQVRIKTYPALGGMGLVDDNYTQTSDGEIYWGTAFRTYEPKEKRWACRWYDAKLQSWSPVFYLKKAGATVTGTIEGSDNFGTYQDRVSFYNIQANSFSWKMDRKYETLEKAIRIGTIEYTRVRSSPKSFP